MNPQHPHCIPLHPRCNILCTLTVILPDGEGDGGSLDELRSLRGATCPRRATEHVSILTQSRYWTLALILFRKWAKGEGFTYAKNGDDR
jgi:hypothetical protein